MSPSGTLIQAVDGELYGNTIWGGASDAGVIFKITLDGKFTLVHNFVTAEGSGPSGALLQDTDGSFYGTAPGGGAYFWGTVYRLSPDGVLTVLYSFTGNTDGAGPLGALVKGSNGDFFGTASLGGAYQWGTIFEISAAGEFTTLHAFTQEQGADPFGGLAQDTDGSFYGTKWNHQRARGV